MMVENVLRWADAGQDFETICEKLNCQIEQTSAFIMVDDLDHLVKGTLVECFCDSGKPFEYQTNSLFYFEGKIEVYKKFVQRKRL